MIAPTAFAGVDLGGVDGDFPVSGSGLKGRGGVGFGGLPTCHASRFPLAVDAAGGGGQVDPPNRGQVSSRLGKRHVSSQAASLLVQTPAERPFDTQQGVDQIAS